MDTNTADVAEIEENMQQAVSSVMDLDLGGLTVSTILSAAVLLCVCLAVMKLLLKGTDRLLRRAEMDENIRGLIRKLVKGVLIILTALMVASALGVSVSSLVALLSVAGLAVSLAIQNLLSNVAGGIQILTSKPFAVGDYVDAADVSGSVSEIGIFYTKLHTIDNKLIQVPNSQIAGAKIVNYTAQPERRVDMKFTASYDAPVETVKQIIQEVMAAHPLTLYTPEPFVRVSGYGESSIEYTLRVWCATGDYWTVYFDLMEQVKAAFDRSGVEMTYPHLNVHMADPGEGRSGGGDADT